MGRLAERYGDCWVWLSFDPVQKILPAFVIGKINQDNADLLLQKTKAVNDGCLHIFFSDQRRHYEEAILKSLGHWVQPGRRGHEDLCPNCAWSQRLIC